MRLTLKSVKAHKDMSEETECFSAALCVDGKKVGEVSNDGHGGPHRYHWLDRAVGKRVEEWAEKQPLEFQHEKLGQIIDGLLAAHLTRADFTRWCKKSTLFRLKGDALGVWRTIKAPFDAKVKAHITAKHGDKVERIANEDIEATVEASMQAFRAWNGMCPAGKHGLDRKGQVCDLCERAQPRGQEVH